MSTARGRPPCWVRRFNGPSFDELLPHRPRPIAGAGRAVGPRHQEPLGITHEHPADGQNGLANPIPHCGPARPVQLTSAAVVPAHAYAVPDGRRLLQNLLQLRHAFPLYARTPVSARLARRSWPVQGRIHPQRGHKHTSRRAQAPPSSSTLYGWSPMMVTSTSGSQRRTASLIWRARCDTGL